MSLIYLDMDGTQPAWVRAETIVDVQVLQREAGHVVLVRRQVAGQLVNLYSPPFTDPVVARETCLRLARLVIGPTAVAHDTT